MSVDYARCLKKFGAPAEGKKLPSSSIDFLKDHVPGTYVDFVEEYGVGKWKSGYFQWCDPLEYQSVLRLLMEGDPDLNSDRSHLLGFSAFGRLLVWNEDYGDLYIDTVYCEVLSSGLFKAEKPDNDIRLGVAAANVDAIANDLPDAQGRGQFNRVLKVCGEVQTGQIYALKLHPAMGGVVLVENFRAVAAFTALSLAAQVGPYLLRNPTVPSVPVVRSIGTV